MLDRLPSSLQQMLLLEWISPETVSAVARAGSSQLRSAVLTSPCAFRAANRTLVRDSCIRWFRERGVPLRLWEYIDHIVDPGIHVWYQNGFPHRDDDLPAMVNVDGSRKWWYRHGRMHRDNDLPAVVDANGTQLWYQNGKQHRADGRPAVIYHFGRKEYFEHGEMTRAVEG